MTNTLFLDTEIDDHVRLVHELKLSNIHPAIPTSLKSVRSFLSFCLSSICLFARNLFAVSHRSMRSHLNRGRALCSELYILTYLKFIDLLIKDE